MGGLKKYYFSKKKGNVQWRFDTIGDNPSDTAFTIRRTTDNVEQNFTYAQIIDGTYDAFLAGASGAVKNWFNGVSVLNRAVGANQMYLLSNGGLPYITNPNNATSLSGNAIISKFSNDWIVSIIHGKELNGNNQRLNLGISGDIVGQNFVLECSTPNTGYIKLNTSTTSFTNPDLSISITAIDKLDVYTYAKIGGVLTIRKNNTILTQGAGGGFTLAFARASVANVVDLGARDANGTGKLNKYQHLGHIAAKDLSSFNLTGYINSLISRYGIT